MKSLDEQIEYMNKKVTWYGFKATDKKSIWNGELEMSKAILDTLLQLKGKQA